MTQASSSREPPRPLLLVSAALFVLSCLFPIAASVSQGDRAPRWMGVADVVIAAVVAVFGMLIMSKKPSEFAPSVVASSFKAYRGLANTLLLSLALFFLVGDGIRWSILVPGLAWRGWLLAMVMPSWLSMWQKERHPL